MTDTHLRDFMYTESDFRASPFMVAERRPDPTDPAPHTMAVATQKGPTSWSV